MSSTLSKQIIPGMPTAHKIAIVVPTIGRYEELRRMLHSLAQQSRLPDQVIIAGEGDPATMSDLTRTFPQLDVEFLPLPRPPICEARNAGVRAARPDVSLIGFMDDDIVLEPGALEAILAFWATAPSDVGGAALNMLNADPPFAPWLKSLSITSWLGLYNTEKGAVLRSGIHTLLGHQHKTIFVKWLPGAAAVYAKKVIEEYPSDEWFRGYGYLEDLDLSYRIGKKYKLAVVADARFYHYPSQVGRENPYLFGKKEVINRLYFVSKNRELSRLSCCVAIMVRVFISAFLGLSKRKSYYFKRVAGNFAGLLTTLSTGLRPVAR